MYTEESIPSTAIWTSSERVGEMIKRSTGLHDCMNGPTFVIGRRLIEALLRDLYEVGGMNRFCRFGYFLSELKRPTCAFTITGIVSLERLVQILSEKRRISSPMVYGCLCELVSKGGVTLKSAVEDGLKVLELTHFPALEILDVHKNAVLKWSRSRYYWKISDTGTGLDEMKSAPMLSALVKGELERRGLIFASKLKNCPVLFPWLEPCVRKLATEKLTDEQLVLVLAFISYIALITHGWFIEYDSFIDLMREGPIQQHRLKELEIQSALNVPFFRKETVHRLHKTIPTKMIVREDKKVQKTNSVEQSTALTKQEVENAEDVVERVSNRIPEEDQSEQEQEVRTRVGSCLPVASIQRNRWSGGELELLDWLLSNRSGKTIAQMFELYKEKCIDTGIPFRTLKAFENRIRRMK